MPWVFLYRLCSWALVALPGAPIQQNETLKFRSAHKRQKKWMVTFTKNEASPFVWLRQKPERLCSSLLRPRKRRERRGRANIIAWLCHLAVTCCGISVAIFTCKSQVCIRHIPESRGESFHERFLHETFLFRKTNKSRAENSKCTVLLLACGSFFSKLVAIPGLEGSQAVVLLGFFPQTINTSDSICDQSPHFMAMTSRGRFLTMCITWESLLPQLLKIREMWNTCGNLWGKTHTFSIAAKHTDNIDAIFCQSCEILSVIFVLIFCELHCDISKFERYRVWNS